MFANPGARGNDLISVTYMPHLSYVRRNKTVSAFGGKHQLVEAVKRSSKHPQIGASLAGERLYLVPIDSLFRIPYVPPEGHATSGSPEPHESREQQEQRELQRKERRKVLQHWNSIIIDSEERAPKGHPAWWERGVPEHPMQSYSAWPVDVAMTHDKEQSFLVFPFEPDAERFRPLSELMVNPDDDQSLLKLGREVADQRDSRIALARSLVKAWGQLRACGYGYGCYDSSNIFYDPKTNEVRLGFSMATLYLPEGQDEPVSQIILGKDVKASHMFDYIEPSSRGLIKEAIDQGKQPCAVLSQADSFAMWAMAFRLMVGRPPLYGQSVPSEPSVSGEDQGKNIDQPRKGAAHTFDSPDGLGWLGRDRDLLSEKVFRENWKAVPKDMRDEMRSLFGSVDSLVRENGGSDLLSRVRLVAAARLPRRARGSKVRPRSGSPTGGDSLVGAGDGSGLPSGVKPPSKETRLVAASRLPERVRGSKTPQRDGSPLRAVVRLVAAARLPRRARGSKVRPRSGSPTGGDSLVGAGDGSGLPSGVKPPSKETRLVAASRLPERVRGSKTPQRDGSPLRAVVRLVAAARLMGRRTLNPKAPSRGNSHLNRRSLVPMCRLMARRRGATCCARARE